MNCTNCKICDKPLFHKGVLNIHGGINQFKCEENHFTINRTKFGETASEVFKYGKYKVIAWFYLNEIIEYGLYYPTNEGKGQLCLSADKVQFDPKNPENILNKLKMMVVFS